ncbi:hypothetical protein ES703_41852 [subsurface metagenome]
MDINQGDLSKDGLLKELTSCRKCKFCVDVCPIYRVSEKAESMGPCGRLQMLRYLLNGKLDLDDSIIYSVYACTGCGRCNVVCNSKGVGLEVSELIRLGRVLLSKELGRSR